MYLVITLIPEIPDAYTIYYGIDPFDVATYLATFGYICLIYMFGLEYSQLTHGVNNDMVEIMFVVISAMIGLILGRSWAIVHCIISTFLISSFNMDFMFDVPFIGGMVVFASFAGYGVRRITQWAFSPSEPSRPQNFNKK